MGSPQKIGVSLRQAFDIKPGDVVSLVGGGGKTTLMFALAHEIEAAGEKVVTTTTTRIFEPSASETFLVVEDTEEELVKSLAKAMEKHRHVTVASLRQPDKKLKGITKETLDRITALKIAPYIINEADGSARKPLKAPNTTEPVIPESTTLVIAIIGIDALGKSLTDENVFRPEIISRLTGLKAGTAITEDAVAELLANPRGIAKGTPARARIIPLVNKIDILPDLSAAESLAGKILAKGQPGIQRVVLGKLMHREPIVKIIGN